MANDNESLMSQIADMTLMEKIQLAMKGDKDARAILIRSANKAVQVAVISNAQISENEIATIANYKNLDDEVLRKIASRKDWVKVHEIRAALVKNPKTPPTIALKMIATLAAREIKMIAKSKQVPTAIAMAAKRCLAAQKA